MSQGAITSTKIREQPFIARVGQVSRFCESSNVIPYIHEEPFSDATDTDDAKEDFEGSSLASWKTTEPETLVESMLHPQL